MTLTEDPRELPQNEEDEGGMAEAIGRAQAEEHMALDEPPRPGDGLPNRWDDHETIPGAGDWHPGLEIRSTEELGAALAVIRAKRAERNHIQRQMEAEIDRVRTWAAKRAARLDDSLEHLEKRALKYAEDHASEVFPPGRQTAEFPSGAIARTTRKKGYYRKLKGADEERRLLAWAVDTQRPEMAGVTLTKPEPVVDLDAVKAFLDEVTSDLGNRIIAPGLEWVPPGTTYAVETKE